MGKLNEFLNRKIIQKDVGEETYLTWKETISYALGRGAHEHEHDELKVYQLLFDQRAL